MMSLDGLEKLMVPRMRDCCQTWSNQPHTAQCNNVPPDSGSTMAQTVFTPPAPPPLVPDGSRQPISAADDSTFDAWVNLPIEDLRTLGEYAANPVRLVRRLPGPPPPPPSRPPNRVIVEGVQPDRPWPRR